VTSEFGWRFDARAAPHRLVPSVRARSSLAAVVVVALALGSGAALLYFVLQRTLLSGLDSAAVIRAGAVAGRLTANGPDELDAMLKATAVEGQVTQVLNPDGRVIADSSSRSHQGPITGLRPGPDQVLREKRGVFKITSSIRPFLVLTRGVRG
jgi:hypothetical protein